MSRRKLMPTSLSLVVPEGYPILGIGRSQARAANRDFAANQRTAIWSRPWPASQASRRHGGQ